MENAYTLDECDGCDEFSARPYTTGRLTVVVEDELVEHAPARLLPDVAVHDVGAEFVEGDGVRERLAVFTRGELSGSGELANALNTCTIGW